MKKLIAASAACLLLVSALGYWLWRGKPETTKGASYDKPGSFSAYVHLSVAQFVPQEHELTGTVSVQLGAADEAGENDAKQYSDLTSLVFEIQHREPSSITIIGQTDKPMVFQPTESQADGTFRWNIQPRRGALLYPFDSYSAEMHPVLKGVLARDPNALPHLPVSTVSADFYGVNFTADYTRGSENGPWFTLVLKRPLWLRVVTTVALVLLVIWGVLVPLSPKQEPAGLLTMFAGVFALRQSILSGAPVFPSLIDYLSILLYLYVVLMVVIRRTWARPERECPFCMSHVHPRATFCPACTRSLTAPPVAAA